MKNKLCLKSKIMHFEEDEKPTNVELFIFNYPTKNGDYLLEIPIEIPFTGLISELSERIINNFSLPCIIEKSLTQSLDSFVKLSTTKYHDKIAFEAIQQAKKSEVDIEDIIKRWEKLYREETVEYGDKRRSSDSEVFSNVYHKLVHSGPALQTMLQVEHSYSLAVAQLMAQKEEQIADLTSKQYDEVNAAFEESSESCINELVAKHFEDQNLLQGRWNSEVDTFKETQRREYREWLMKLLEDQTQKSVSLWSPTTPIDLKMFSENLKDSKSGSVQVMEESYTIHLGSQLKQMHNIRILSANVLDFCILKPQTEGNNPTPQRLQTALGLYSNDLCGLVLLNDRNDFSEFSGIAKEFRAACENSTEFHFQCETEQLENLKTQMIDAVSWRNSCQHPGNLTTFEQQNRRNASKNLQTGDVYVTKHSNLASVHIVFHMTVDDSLRSNEINSRHPAILGLRNILKTACSNDITTLTIPVLLMHEMTEEMTVAWCTKRAELVFKCVKGFMIEMASWGGSDLKNLQFLVPEGISEEVFTTLATMLPSIFRVSNPLVFKASSTPSTPKKKSSK